MSNLYGKIREQSDGLNDYTAVVKLALYSQDHDRELEYDKQVQIPYNIDLDIRNWGIKDISLLVTDTIEIPYSVVEYDANGEESSRQDKALTLDLSTAEIEWVAGGSFGLSELDISLTAEGGIASAKLVAMYIQKG